MAARSAIRAARIAAPSRANDAGNSRPERPRPVTNSWTRMRIVEWLRTEGVYRRPSGGHRARRNLARSADLGRTADRALRVRCARSRQAGLDADAVLALGVARERVLGGLRAGDDLGDRRLLCQRALDRFLRRLIVEVVDLLVVLRVPVDEDADHHAVVGRLVPRDDAA